MNKKIIFISLLAGMILITGCTKTKQEDSESSVFLKINPEIELVVKGEVVTAVNALNEDANVLIVDNDLIGKTIDEVLEIVIDEAMELGFIDEVGESEFTIETINENEATREKLEKRIRERIQNLINKKDIVSNVKVRVLSSDLMAKAEENGITYGKMMMINRIMATDETKSFDNLKDLSVEELSLLLRENFKDFKEINQEQIIEIRRLREEKKATIKLKLETFRERVIEFIENRQNLSEEEIETKYQERLSEIKSQYKNKLID
jgi:hypothetical protein